VLGGVDGSLHFTTVHEQAQSNRACNIFNFAVFGFQVLVWCLLGALPGCVGELRPVNVAFALLFFILVFFSLGISIFSIYCHINVGTVSSTSTAREFKNLHHFLPFLYKINACCMKNIYDTRRETRHVSH
jgi:hypothetical protein